MRGAGDGNPAGDSEVARRRTGETAIVSHLPMPLTSFIGRKVEVDEVRRVLGRSRLVTLSGAGGLGKTRLAVEVAGQVARVHADGVCYVDFAPLTDADLAAVTVARALGLRDQPGLSAVDTVLRFVGDRQLLLILDNCEHLLDSSAVLVSVLLGACPNLGILATSREPIGVAGEVIWRVPSLSLNDEAVVLFTDRAHLVRPAFSLTETHRATVTEICRRLDGMPLAIELAAARLRVLSPTEILDGLNDRFRLLTGGKRSAVPRHQTLRASVDWSHALLTKPERRLFCRLAVFMGGFDLDAVQAVASGDGLAPDQILDLLTLLVDKSLVIADADPGRTRYQLLETVRQYAFEKLGESGEADAVRLRHRDFYTLLASVLDTPARTGQEQSLARAIVEIDNCRAAFAWSLNSDDAEAALALASSLQPLWLALGRVHEGLAWFDAVLTEDGSHATDVAPGVYARALADTAVLRNWAFGNADPDQAEQALAIARERGDQVLLARALTSRGIVAAHYGEPVHQYFGEAAALARTAGDRWRLSQILAWQATMAFLAGEPIAALAVAAEGRELADAVGDRFASHQCRTWGGWAVAVTGDLAGAARQLGAVEDSAKADHDLIWWVVSVHYAGQVAAYRGDFGAAQAGFSAASPALVELGSMWGGNSHGVRAAAALAAGDVEGVDHAGRAAYEQLASVPAHQSMYVFLLAEVGLARGDLPSAGRWADEAVSAATGWYRVLSLTTRARVLMARRELEHAERDAYDALALAVDLQADLGVPDILECLAAIGGAGGNRARSARLFGAAESIRRQMGAVRFKVHDADHEASVTAVRNTLGNKDFDAAYTEGAALSVGEAIAYAKRGKGQRKRPLTGWGSLTPAERDVVRLVCDGLANKEIAKRLLVSPRTVQTHLTHVYTKLGLTSRVQLVQEASRHDD
ncbi:LuxR family transcriptional regulator [Mycolicibacterium moriokaense]|nr:LuxR family transcriptional regulator [Mycolicibacterium moriokaense]